MNDYDPNPQWSIHVVEVDLMQWDAKATLRAEVGGNCAGLDVINAAIDRITRDLPDDQGVTYVELKEPTGDTLICEDDDGREEDWLKDMVVAVRIVERKPDPKRL